MTLFHSRKIELMHEQLNSKALVPGRSYRRNVVVYELLCYVNNIVACYVAKNEEPIPIFIGRARTYLASAKPSEEWSGYYAYVEQYLNEMEMHLIDHGVDPKCLS